ncbi:MAG TPA: polysaccharide deacetylase family protein [Baekduia sp.]|uniref:polysaccharide deacetylase family protein n=1 Tax=Baekduia sp. TaxID=2600305 RepID=UPI002D776A1F|nr:polysaccharide deacetylase family protein [Baekduia sp.]HET6507974.1 polysaccharide deacetylase family protein [Baekduia sp.]
MPADPRAGAMDNPYTAWSPLRDRRPVRWPGGARVAVCVLLNVEHVEWLPPDGVFVPPSAVRRPPYPRLPDPHEVSPHEYGNRVGIFRLIEALDARSIPASVPIDAASAERYPGIVRRCVDRGWELLGHGLSASRMISGAMSEPEERAYIARSLDAVQRATGQRPVGWSSIEYAQSARTIRLLAEAGVRYMCDWPNDEQPYELVGDGAGVVALPTAIELDDVYTIHMRRVPPARWSQMIVDAYDRLERDGAESGRVLVISLHPWLTGQPFRMRHVEAALDHVAGRPRAWCATAGEIVDRYREQASA